MSVGHGLSCHYHRIGHRPQRSHWRSSGIGAEAEEAPHKHAAVESRSTFESGCGRRDTSRRRLRFDDPHVGQYIQTWSESYSAPLTHSVKAVSFHPFGLPASGLRDLRHRRYWVSGEVLGVDTIWTQSVSKPGDPG